MLGTRSIKTTAKAWAIDLAIRMVDLTTLEGADTPGKVRALCAKALRPDPADPTCPRGGRDLRLPVDGRRSPPRRCAGSGVHLASVATAFPSGQAPLDVKLADTRAAVAAGADEIDMVINRGAFLAGRYLEVFEEIVAVKEACGGAHLKVILETGELATYDNVRRASWLAMLAGGDFIKTSTGKVPAGRDAAGHAGHAGGGPRLPGRRPAARSASSRPAASAPPRTPSSTWCMVNETVGDDWLDPDWFRFGASTLLNDLLMQRTKLTTGRYAGPDYFTLD